MALYLGYGTYVRCSYTTFDGTNGHLVKFYPIFCEADFKGKSLFTGTPITAMRNLLRIAAVNLLS